MKTSLKKFLIGKEYSKDFATNIANSYKDGLEAVITYLKDASFEEYIEEVLCDIVLWRIYSGKDSGKLVAKDNKTFLNFAYFINELNNSGALTHPIIKKMFINELNNSGALTSPIIKKMISSMEQHNNQPWKKEDVYAIIAKAYEVVMENNLA